MLYMIKTNIREHCSPFRTPFLCTPRCPPFHIRDPKVEITEFSPFLWSDLLFIGAYRTLPPFLHPLFSYLKSPRCPLQILYLSFFVKMISLDSTDPFPKNELAILLCFAISSYFFHRRFPIDNQFLTFLRQNVSYSLTDFPSKKKFFLIMYL